MVIVITGVSGSGKSTLGRALAAAMGCEFVEGDDYHSQGNIDKMRAGRPLDDADRWPWLERLNRHILARTRGGGDVVLACSALKRSYRNRLGSGVPDLAYIFLCGEQDTIRQRLECRQGHFMPAALLASQFDTLEPAEGAIFVSIELPTQDQVQTIMDSLESRSSTIATYQAETVAHGLAFPEAPRWHADRLWFTDQHARAVYAMDSQGKLETIARTSDLPGGLGWLPDGRLLVVYMTERRVMQLTNGELSEYADLSSLASFHCNDMLVDSRGRAYVGNFGFDLHGGAEISPAEILMIDEDHSVALLTLEVVFPNGSVIPPSGDQLIVAETFAHRLSTFPLDARGRLGPRETWADLGDVTPDGICLDAEGAIWVASPGTREVIRVRRGGATLARCETEGTPYACMLGGEDRRKLYLCTSESDDPATAARLGSGRIEQVRVPVPGAGLP